MRFPSLSLRDKFLLSFLGLAVALTGILALLAINMSNILPELSQSQADRYRAQLTLRDLREAVLIANIPDDLDVMRERRDDIAHTLVTYESSMSIGTMPDVYEALVSEDKGHLVAEEEGILADIRTSLRDASDAIELNALTGALTAMHDVVAGTHELEDLNADVLTALHQADQTSRRVFRTYFLVAGAILLLGITAFARILSSWITRPLRRMQAATMRIAEGDFSHELTSDSNDELGMLTQSFDHMRKQVLSSIETVRRAAEKDELLINSIVDVIIAVDQQERVILFNDAAQRLTGFAKDDALGRKLEELLTLVTEEPNHGMPALVASVIESGQSQSLARPVVVRGRKSESDTPVTMSVAPFLETSGERGAVVVLHDVSETVELDKLREEFVSIASHQLRTPLTAIRWLLETMIRGETERKVSLEPKYHDTLHQAYSRTLSMSELVSSLLALSRLDAQKVQAKLAPVSIADLFEKLQLSFTSMADRKGSTLVMTNDVSEPVQSDQVILTEVLSNIINNAVKYSREGAHIDVHARIDGDRLVFTVKDDGIGIPKDQQQTIFKKFFRAKNALTFTPEGTGIGLYMVKSFVELLGGEIDFVSEENKGTTFTLSFPLSASHG